jgi:hypothetical protein
VGFEGKWQWRDDVVYALSSKDVQFGVVFNSDGYAINARTNEAVECWTSLSDLMQMGRMLDHIFPRTLWQMIAEYGTHDGEENEGRDTTKYTGKRKRPCV